MAQHEDEPRQRALKVKAALGGRGALPKAGPGGVLGWTSACGSALKACIVTRWVEEAPRLKRGPGGAPGGTSVCGNAL